MDSVRASYLLLPNHTSKVSYIYSFNQWYEGAIYGELCIDM